MMLDSVDGQLRQGASISSSKQKHDVAQSKEYDSRQNEELTKKAAQCLTSYAKAEINMKGPSGNPSQKPIVEGKIGSVLDNNTDYEDSIEDDYEEDGFIKAQIETYVNETLGWQKIDKIYKNGSELIHIIYQKGCEAIDSKGNIYVLELEDFSIKEKATKSEHRYTDVSSDRIEEEDELEDEEDEEDEWEDEQEEEWAQA